MIAKEQLTAHLAWLNDEKGGVRLELRGADLRGANLSYADLSYANLRYANLADIKLWGTVGNMQEIKCMQIEKYKIAYTVDRLQIGCEQHSIEGWKAFDDRRIIQMDGKDALVWWKKSKPLIMQTIELFPAVDWRKTDA